MVFKHYCIATHQRECEMMHPKGLFPKCDLEDFEGQFLLISVVVHLKMTCDLTKNKLRYDLYTQTSLIINVKYNFN